MIFFLTTLMNLTPSFAQGEVVGVWFCVVFLSRSRRLVSFFSLCVVLFPHSRLKFLAKRRAAMVPKHKEVSPVFRYRSGLKESWQCHYD